MTTLRAGSATDVGQVRSNNQDSQLVVTSTSLFGVADGMGGHQGGEVASAMAVQITEEHATEPTLESLKAAVRLANRTIFEKAGSDRDLHGMGTTLVAVQVVDGPEGQEVAWVNVGDSRVYLLRDDRLIQLSADHSLVEDLVRDGQLTPAEAAVHPQRNILTRALGIDLDVEVDGATVLPFTGDRFLLCSDGLFNEVSEDQMASVLRRLVDPTEAADELVRLANEGGGRDNITVVVVDVVDDGGRAAAASAALVDDPTQILATPVAPAAAAATSPAEPVSAADAPPAFADRRSSLPEAHDDFGSESDDLFANLDSARSRRFTWRVVAFVVLVLALLAAGFGAVWYSSEHSYYVTFKGDQVALYRGKPGGVLVFDPTLLRTTKLTRDDVEPALRPGIEKGKEFGSKADADRYLLSLADVASQQETTTTTTVVTTTTAPPGGSTTTAPTTTSTTTAGP
ncbi:Stp1/IreP family PP2C-type Ser/Thr phosphatase [Aquihabitans sp. G128]|uniref:Stp1/IreP family PP2C-type Ser/Thr phosphatase n=1 Tax=Aquihabitans sp. G128 TaxID=2849779 RepID=UPI001C21E7EB|nr:Stp1/IreP family PP2C-type Ser/Thr phosphatase [Aquihabitans sp. G128]QXC59732.1 Stp1/IreP family PP2C-type Ser/Thr phosphatase [Aquihabitans sp. G128]